MSPAISATISAALSIGLTATPPVTYSSVNPTRVPSLAFSTVIPSALSGNESFPVERDGVLYVTTAQARVVAMDAYTGQTRWTYTPVLHVPRGIPEANRGVALAGDHVYVLTADDQLIALNRHTGHMLFDVTVADVNAGNFETMAPLVADGNVIVGCSGGDMGIRGFVAAYSAATGKFLWRFYTIPARGTGWVPATGSHGGGAVWTTPAYSPQTHAIYFGTGNPSPDYYGEQRPGPNLYTDCVISLDISTGKMRWYQQEVPHDLWDYDVASPPILFPVNHQLAVGEAGKDGFWYEWDANTGKPIANPIAFVKQQHSPPTPSGTLEWPGPGGGANYGPSAYSPLLHLAYIAGINGPETVYSGPTLHTGYNPDFGTHQNPAPKSQWTGTITAIRTTDDTNNPPIHTTTNPSGAERIAWQIAVPSPPIGGVTNDGDGTISFGLPDGTVQMESAATGKTVWVTHVGVPIGSAPVVYRRGGEMYLAVVTGGSASLAGMYPWSGADKVIVWRWPAPANNGA